MKYSAPIIAPEGGCARLACCVPFCRRTFKSDKAGTPWAEGSEVICGKHFRLINVGRRRRYSGLKRRYLTRKGTLQGPLGERLARILEEEWARLKVIAIEAAAGIA